MRLVGTVCPLSSRLSGSVEYYLGGMVTPPSILTRSSPHESRHYFSLIAVGHRRVTDLSQVGCQLLSSLISTW
jgi:hypothetical protein